MRKGQLISMNISVTTILSYDFVHFSQHFSYVTVVSSITVLTFTKIFAFVSFSVVLSVDGLSPAAAPSISMNINLFKPLQMTSNRITKSSHVPGFFNISEFNWLIMQHVIDANWLFQSFHYSRKTDNASLPLMRVREVRQSRIFSYLSRCTCPQPVYTRPIGINEEVCVNRSRRDDEQNTRVELLPMPAIAERVLLSCFMTINEAGSAELAIHHFIPNACSWSN